MLLSVLHFVVSILLSLVIRYMSCDNKLTKTNYLQTLVRIFPKDTLLWKLQLLKSASASAHSHMYTVKAQTLILLRFINL